MSSAKYHQIKDHILTQIRSGQWQEFQRVPSENQLAQQVGFLGSFRGTITASMHAAGIWKPSALGR